ncbi:MAG: hypothetical protein KAV99_04250 [Candidatus Latescibacteria bacterium]|nr:hypothetical protein [Candidatus Latescibacterota bacterium]
MIQVGVDKIEKDLPVYLQRVEAGETIVIVKSGKPMAELKPVVSASKGLRPSGVAQCPE